MPTFVSSHILCLRSVDMYMYIYLVWMLLVVNIVTCPIGTDCGGSAPVVGLYRQQRAFCPTGNYCTVRVVRKCRFECHINCMHNVQCGTMKTIPHKWS